MTFCPQTLVDWAQVLSAIATTAAVIVSLHLARRRPVPELQGYAGIYFLVNPGLPRPWPEFINVSATNIGSVDAVITGLGWQLHHWRKSKRAYAVQNLRPVVHGLPNPKLPARITQGEELTFRMPITGPENWFKMVEEHGLFSNRVLLRKDLDRLRAHVYTSVGPGLMITPAKETLDRIWTAQQTYLEGRLAAKEANQ
jgi:hypothetical protein